MQIENTGTASADRRKPQQPISFTQRLDLLALQRAQRMAQIAALRKLTTSKFLDDAYRLLVGRFWSRARVQSREQLLQTVDWLFVLARSDVPGRCRAPEKVNRRKTEHRSLGKTA